MFASSPASGSSSLQQAATALLSDALVVDESAVVVSTVSNVGKTLCTCFGPKFGTRKNMLLLLAVHRYNQTCMNVYTM